MNTLSLFDSWVCYGPRPEKDPQERWTLKHLLDDMDFCGIASALVRHEQMGFYDLAHINDRLLREIAPHRDRLVPCLAVQPHQFGDFPHADEFARHLDDHGIAAVFFQPTRNGYPVHQDILHPLAEKLNPRKTLILTTLNDLQNDYQTVLTFCRLFADCPILLGCATWSQWRLVLAVMDACPNIHLELHLFQANRAVEFLTARYGIERILFGSGLLRHSGGAARGFIDWSMLNDQTMADFSGANLARLLANSHQPQPRKCTAPDPFIDAASQGKPLSGTILDAHCHVLDNGVNGAGASYVMIQGDAPHMLQLTRRMGVQKTAMMSWNGTVSMDVEAGNDLIEQVVDSFPEDIIGLSSCDPTHQRPQQIQAMCRHLHLEKGFRGMKPYWTNCLSYADPRYKPYWDFGQEHHLYALLHVDARAGGIEAVKTLAQRYPDLTILIAHSGGSWAFARQVAEVVTEFSNVMAELTLTPVPNGIIEWLCGQVGADRVLFGTDAPMRDPRPQLGWCVYTRLDIDAKKKILGENFAAILARSRL